MEEINKIFTKINLMLKDHTDNICQNTNIANRKEILTDLFDDIKVYNKKLLNLDFKNINSKITLNPTIINQQKITAKILKEKLDSLIEEVFKLCFIILF